MKLSTGQIAFPIEFDNGDKDCIYFNPNDPNLAIRIDNMREKIQSKMKDLADIELNESGEPQNDSSIEKFREIQDFLIENMNLAFGNDICSVVFKYCSPFAIVNGNYFIMQFLEAVKPEIEKHIKKANADVEKKMSKHINKYKK